MGITYESILDNETLVYYIMILIGIIFVFSKLVIGLNLVFGFIIGCIVVYFLYKDYKGKQEKENNVKSFQESLLLPKPEILADHEKVEKYLFSIQDFYVYNPKAYEEMVNALANFLRIYEETTVNPKYAGRNYDLMKGQKKEAMNALHSIIYNFPTNKDYTEKLENAIIVMENVLQEYLDKVERIQKLYLYENGYNIDTKMIDKSGVEGYNSFDSDNASLFSYEIF